MKNYVKPAAAVILAMAAFSLTACTTAGSPTIPDTIRVENASNVITVQSSEKVQVVPDIAEIEFAVSSQAADARECQELNSKDLDNVIQFLKGAGVEEKSIQTSNYGLNPIYDWNSGQTITGYEMRTSLTVSDLPIDQVGALISSCVDAGINNITSVSYQSSQYDASYQEALKKAIASAQTKASAIAEAGGCTIVKIAQVTEQSSNSQVRYTGYRNEVQKSMDSAADSAAMTVAPGQVDVEASISVDFEIH